ncbi:MAG TPA: hypothetical protein VNC78_07125 [Actinomycetota bacterium]|nr:hypothetical protein [Actinomycetota bacterium]
MSAIAQELGRIEVVATRPRRTTRLFRRIGGFLEAEARRSRDHYALAMMPTATGRETGARC